MGSNSAVCRGQVLASGEDSGKIKLFRYPVFGFKQTFRSYIGHGSHVMDVKFTSDDDYLISAGINSLSTHPRVMGISISAGIRVSLWS
jgi:hypothetical protein